MSKRSSCASIVALCGLLSLGGAAAPAQQAEPPASADSPSQYQLSGTDLPQVYLVEAFFTLIPTMWDASPPLREYHMAMFGIELGSPAEAALSDAVARVRKLMLGDREPTVVKSSTAAGAEQTLTRGGLEGPDFSGVPEEEWDTLVDEHGARQSRALADIWFDLEQSLEREGVPMAGIERFLLEELASGVSVASAGPLDLSDPRVYSFQDQTLKRRQQKRSQSLEGGD